MESVRSIGSAEEMRRGQAKRAVANGPGREPISRTSSFVLESIEKVGATGGASRTGEPEQFGPWQGRGVGNRSEVSGALVEWRSECAVAV